MQKSKSVKKVVKKSVKKSSAKNVTKRSIKNDIVVSESADRGQLSIAAEILRLKIKNTLGIK